MKKYIFFLFIIILNNGILSAQSNKGSLVIVGGGLEQNNKDVFTELIALSGGADKAIFSIIPAASGTPVQSFDYFKNELIAYHVKPENIVLVKLAVVDDDSTKDVDESLWKANGNNPEIIKTIENSTCIWFSGGDQLRITETLFNKDGSETKALNAIRKRYKNGAVIGGTSAGAAIMSERMIGSGTAISSLKFGIFTDEKYNNLSADSGVYLTKGLGFFENGMVDQHFKERARLARLIMAMFYQPKINYGFGIDENTALIYYDQEDEFCVMGTGGVTFIDLSEADMSLVSTMPSLKKIKLSYLSSGDRFNFKTLSIMPDKTKKLITGNENYDDNNVLQSDLLSGSRTNFYTVITQDLMDNKGINKIENINFMGNGMGYCVRFTKTDASQGFFGSFPDGTETYTIINLVLDIVPIKINYTPLE